MITPKTHCPICGSQLTDKNKPNVFLDCPAPNKGVPHYWSFASHKEEVYLIGNIFFRLNKNGTRLEHRDDTGYPGTLILALNKILTYEQMLKYQLLI